MRKLLILLIFISGSLAAQQADSTYRFSMEEAIKFGIENNYSSVNAEKDVEIALKQKWEIIAQGLPQIDATGEYQNNLKLPVQLLPAEIAGGEQGEFIPVTFGQQHSVNGTATWNQLIFDGSYIVGIQSSKTLLQISKNSKTKTDQEIKKAIIDAYGNVLLAEENIVILEENLENIQSNLKETRALYENGMSEQEDVQQLEITELTIDNNLNRSRRMRDIAYEMLNITLGLPITANVELTEQLEDLSMEYFDLALLEKEIPIEENIDYRIAKNTAESAEIEVKLEKAKALPTLSGFLNYGVQGFNQDFTFFDSEQEYFTQSLLGISLNIPIFSSGMRSARTQQKKIAYEQKLEELEQTENEVKNKINTAKSDYEFSLENFSVQQKNLALSERIEEKNQVKYFEGVGSSFELREAQQQLYTAQQEYLEAMLEVITNKAELENLLDTTTYEE